VLGRYIIRSLRIIAIPPPPRATSKRDMLKRYTKLSALCALAFLIINVFLAAVTNVSTRVTASDASVFRSIYRYEQPKQPLSFDQQIQLIKRVQASVINTIPMGEPIPEFQSREPEDLIRNKTGLCYDRSRTLDKLYSWLGFEARHVYILYLKQPVTDEVLSPLSAIFTFGTETHAVTEVKTHKGWVLVDSNSTWVSLTRDGAPVHAGDIYGRASEFDDLPDYFNQPYIAIRGMYSRRGQFYRPYIPYPELNWADFWGWLIESQVIPPKKH
jgi:hypothetical protein